MKNRKIINLFLALASLLAASLIDILTPAQYIFASFYIIPILIISFTFGSFAISLITALVIVIYSVVAYFSEHLAVSQILLQTTGYIIIAVLAIRIRVEKKKYEEIVQQLELFMHMISHDLAQPLTSAKLYTQVLERNQGKNLLQTTKKISGSLRSIEKLMLDLKDIAQARNGKFKINPEKMNLYGLVYGLAKQQQKVTETHTITVNVPKNINGKWDADRLNQVFTNLLSNAIKYTKGGDITINAQRYSDNVLISIRDCGRGITQKQQRLIFQPYIRVTNDKKIAGSGLGLYISKMIIESHQGKIWVSSKLNHGTTFFIQLPNSMQKKRKLILSQT